ncbi:hypothetical protein [Mycobacterium sp.]|uniref:hypothetical protein n=1 Tax=Mycobacterium sp. TaxID=1785 RepID=UPI0031E288F7
MKTAVCEQIRLGGAFGEFVPRWRVTCAVVVAKSVGGQLHHCYRGTELDWLSDEQQHHFCRLALVERIDADSTDTTASIATDSPPASTDSDVSACLLALRQVGVDISAGAPTARVALRAAGHKFGNSVVAEAVRVRKQDIT